MEVQLYVYDLTRGMARTMSRQFLGIHIDAVYHTSIVFNSVEYFFGQGVQTCSPGTTHHGQPMDIISMGSTQLPMDAILDYLESLKDVYTPESYDLFAHNCNNFTNDFGMFLVGKVIPEHITSLPRRVLDTPFGQMLKPQLDAGMRSVTQAPLPTQNLPRSGVADGPSRGSRPSNEPAGAPVTNGKPPTKAAPWGQVVNLTSLNVLEEHMRSAQDACATIFFTSSTCAPCKLAYPAFDSLAEQCPGALFIKVDINSAHHVAGRFQIRATPTFMTFSRGSKIDEWTGADPGLLKANVKRVIQQTFPPHPHTQLSVPTLQFGIMRSVTYAKVPPLDKLMAKLGEAGRDADLQSLRSFIEKRNGDPKEAALPNLQAVSKTLHSKVLALPLEVRFAAVDLLRCAMVDPRVSGYFAEEQTSPTIPATIKHVLELKDCPHNLRLVTLHLASNAFTSPLYTRELMTPDNASAPFLVPLVTSSLLDTSHPTTRVAAASLAFNLATANYRERREDEREGLADEQQSELAASLIESLSSEENGDAAKAMLLALGYLVYCSPRDGELMDLCQALDAKDVVRGGKGHEKVREEVANLL